MQTNSIIMNNCIKLYLYYDLKHQFSILKLVYYRNKSGQAGVFGVRTHAKNTQTANY